MKFLKGLLMVLVILIAGVVITGLVLPSEFTLQREAVIAAPQCVVYEQIADFRNWGNWSPWEERDSTIQKDYSGEAKAVGAGWHWTGDPEKTGEGEMTCTAIDSVKMEYKLHFIKPYDSESMGFISAEPKGDSTVVTWGMSGKSGFVERIMVAMMGGMEKMVGPDFDRGLERLGEAVAASGFYKPEMVELGEMNYIGIRGVYNFDQLTEQLWSDSYARLMGVVAERGMELAGAPFSFGHSYDKEAGIMDLEIALPVKSLGELPEGITSGTLPAGRALKQSYFGPYEGTEPVWNDLMGYVDCAGYKMRYSGFESYITDTEMEPDTTKWQTDVILPIE